MQKSPLWHRLETNNLQLYVFFRFLQSKYGQAESQKYLSAIMKLVLTLLAEH
jgi:hypothetical protein